MSLDKATRAQIRREIKDLAKQERAANADLRVAIRSTRNYIKKVSAALRENDRFLNRLTKRAAAAAEKIRRRRAILEGRLS